MIIGFDLDGVMYDWQQSAYDWCIRAGLTDVDYKTFWLEWMPTQSKIFLDNLIKDPTLYENHIPSKEFFEFMNRVGSKHTIFYITHRPEEVERVTMRFMEKYNYPQWENTILCKDKVPVILSNGVELFVEDRHYIANEVAQVCKSLLINKVWNEGQKLDPRVIRIKTIYEVEDYLE